jgi:hypothetical protein
MSSNSLDFVSKRQKGSRDDHYEGCSHDRQIVEKSIAPNALASVATGLETEPRCG